MDCEAKVYRILVINPGSTSTKIAVFENKEKILQFNVAHDAKTIASFSSAVYDQNDYRLQCILDELWKREIDPYQFDAYAGRGGFFTVGAKSGTYRVDEVMEERLKHPTSEHVANLGGLLAKTLADKAGVNAYITDPVCVDEMTEVAKISGIDGIERLPKWQPLSHKATGRHLAEVIGKKYEECNLIIGHLGGGVTIGAHRQGRVIDVNNGLDGDGPFSADRPGQIPICDMIRYCFDSGLTKEEVTKTFLSKGGLCSYFGTSDMREAEKLALSGDHKAELVLEAMAYGIAKEIGSDAAVLKGNVDAIGLTGGLAHSEFLTSRITERVSFIAPVYLFPGEMEMEALAGGALQVLTGEKQAMAVMQ